MTAAAERRPPRAGVTVVLLLVLGVAFPVLYALALVVAGLALVYVSGRLAGFVMYLLWLLVLPLFAALSALFIRPEWQHGEPLVPEHAPELFATLERLRHAVRAGRIDAVYLTGEWNAALAQLPRRGLFGGTRTQLHLGLPLMLAMDEAHFTAALAHEIGHLARRPGRLGARIYAMRSTLDVIFNVFEERRSVLLLPVVLFYRLFVPRFERASIGLSRLIELDADAAAAAAVGSTTAAEALVVLHGIAAFYQAELLPEIARTVETEPLPPADVYAVIAQRFRAPLAGGRRLVAAALAEPTAEEDTHPALADRLRHLGVEPPALEALFDGYAVRGPSAADVFVPGALAQRRALAYQWQSAMRAEWAAKHAEHVRVRARLTELDALGETAGFGARRERAVLAAELQRSDAAELLTALSDEAPQDPELAYLAGAELAERDDERAVGYLERAMAGRPAATVAAASIARSLYARRNDPARVAEYDERIARFRTAATAATDERRRFTGAEPIEPHGLGDHELTPFRRALELPDLAAAYLARRRVVHLNAIPQYVLAVVRTKTKWATSDRNIANMIEHELSRTTPFPVTVVVSTNPKHRAVAALRRIDATRLTL